MNLQDRALEAIEVELTEESQQMHAAAALHARKTAQLIQELFETPVEEILIDEELGTAHVDGMTFVAGTGDCLRLLGTCSRCGYQTGSRPITSLRELGMVLASAENDHFPVRKEHRCGPADPDPERSAADRVIEALREALGLPTSQPD